LWLSVGHCVRTHKESKTRVSQLSHDLGLRAELFYDLRRNLKKVVKSRGVVVVAVAVVVVVVMVFVVIIVVVVVVVVVVLMLCC